MTPVPWLRAASIISFLFAVGHTLGGQTDWSPIGESDVLSAMRTVTFDVEGVHRTYLSLYRGFGYSLTLFLLWQGVILWQLSTLARTQPSQARPLVGVFALMTLVNTWVIWHFLFPLPAAFSAVLALCGIVAFLTAGRTPTHG
jgi:hypothetical protein